MKRRKVNPTEPCRRCGKPAENPKLTSGIVPSPAGNVSVRHVVLCDGCWMLSRTDLDKFWKRGWGL